MHHCCLYLVFLQCTQATMEECLPMHAHACTLQGKSKCTTCCLPLVNVMSGSICSSRLTQSKPGVMQIYAHHYSDAFGESQLVACLADGGRCDRCEGAVSPDLV